MKSKNSRRTLHAKSTRKTNSRSFWRDTSGVPLLSWPAGVRGMIERTDAQPGSHAIIYAPFPLFIPACSYIRSLFAYHPFVNVDNLGALRSHPSKIVTDIATKNAPEGAPNSKLFVQRSVDHLDIFTHK